MHHGLPATVSGHAMSCCELEGSSSWQWFSPDAGLMSALGLDHHSWAVTAGPATSDADLNLKETL